MAFRVRLWCRDCTGVDPKGCFGGGTELVTTGEPPYDVADFATLREAVDEGYKLTRDCGPWEFDVETTDGDEIDIDEMTDAFIEAFSTIPTDAKTDQDTQQVTAGEGRGLKTKANSDSIRSDTQETK